MRSRLKLGGWLPVLSEQARAFVQRGDPDGLALKTAARGLLNNRAAPGQTDDIWE